MSPPPALPDEDLPRQITAAEQAIDSSLRRWLERAAAVAGLAAGWSLLLPWTYSRRLGLQVWQLGFEEHPQLGAAWVVGFAAAVVALVLRDRPAAVVATSVAGSAAVVFSGLAWQQIGLEATSESWSGPGPSVAITAGLLWILSCTARLLTERLRTPTSWQEYEIRDAISRLRRSRTDRPVDSPHLRPAPPDDPTPPDG